MTTTDKLAKLLEALKPSNGYPVSNLNDGVRADQHNNPESHTVGQTM